MSRPSTSAALRKLSERAFDPLRLPEVLSEINDGPDRSLAIVWSALVEDALGTAILARMSHLTPSEKARLFTGYGPLSSFSAKIMIAYASSLVTKEQKDDLNRIREIRNAFAHGFMNLSFDLKEVSEICKLLNAAWNWPGADFSDPRHLFNLTCMKLWSNLGKHVEGVLYSPHEGIRIITCRKT